MQVGGQAGSCSSFLAMRRPVPGCLPVLAVGVHKSAAAGALQDVVIFPATLPGKLDEERHIQAALQVARKGLCNTLPMPFCRSQTGWPLGSGGHLCSCWPSSSAGGLGLQWAFQSGHH